MKNKKNRGFTLIEVLVVMGIIAILAAVVLIAINPARQFAQANNSQRTANVNAILNAIGQRLADNKGIFQGSIGSQTCPDLGALTIGNKYDIIMSGTPSTGQIDLSCLVPTYISAFPTDPTYSASDGGNTLYELEVDTNGRVTVHAPETQSPLTTNISVTR